MERLRGIILRKDPPGALNFTPEIARRLSESFLDNLARLHSLDYQAIGLGDLGKPQGYLERQVRGWIERYHASRTHDLPEVEKISIWLNQRIPAASDAALIHNDYKYDNLVLDPADITQVVGVLDWEMSTIGDPLSDLGTALAYWVNAKDPEELLEYPVVPVELSRQPDARATGRAIRAHHRARRFVHGLLSGLRAIQSGRHLPADLLPLPAGAYPQIRVSPR